MTSSGRDFTLDRFQLEAIEHLDAGRSVLVAAPTGSGKTVVAEHAIDRALSERKRAFYTAPIKALSNQKYRDLSERIGSSRVGLLTGDNAINADADIVVMTTEVLRNMLYEGRALDDLAFVIMDEVHYLEDTFRGPVWEEVMLHLPAHAKLVCLSATVSNTDELAGWIESIRGRPDVSSNGSGRSSSPICTQWETDAGIDFTSSPPSSTGRPTAKAIASTLICAEGAARSRQAGEKPYMTPTRSTCSIISRTTTCCR